MTGCEGYYVATTDGASERKLARSLGYPPTWHVVRIVPHPADAALEENESDNEEDNNNGNSKSKHEEKKPRRGWSCQDIIHTGDPSAQCDLYYNHSAALAAALDWVEGESTGFETNGGQMLPRQALYKVSDEVEVHYPSEQKWYRARVEKVKHYVNDVRYTVHYVDEDATQVVSEELLRMAPPKVKKKRQSASSSSGSKRKSSSKKKKTPSKPSKKSPTPRSKKKPTTTSTKKPTKPKKPNPMEEPPNTGKARKDYVAKISKQDRLDCLQFARTAMGLPPGWLAAKQGKSRFVILSFPEGIRFTTKKAAYEYLGWTAEEALARVHEAAASDKIMDDEDDEDGHDEEQEDESDDHQDDEDLDEAPLSNNDDEHDNEDEEEDDDEDEEEEDESITDEDTPPRKKKQRTTKKKKSKKKRKRKEKRKRHDTSTDEDSSSRGKRKRRKKDKKERKKKRRSSSSHMKTTAVLVGEERGGGKLRTEPPEEGDPPWRRDGHDYLGRRIRYTHTVPPQEDDDGEETAPKQLVQLGRVTGWLDATDVDSEGAPAFLSEVTGEPAKLFHVTFEESLRDVDPTGELISMDLEDYELEECLLDCED